MSRPTPYFCMRSLQVQRYEPDKQAPDVKGPRAIGDRDCLERVRACGAEAEAVARRTVEGSGMATEMSPLI